MLNTKRGGSRRPSSRLLSDQSAAERHRSRQPVRVRRRAAEDLRARRLLDHEADVCDRDNRVDARPVVVRTPCHSTANGRRGRQGRWVRGEPQVSVLDLARRDRRRGRGRADEHLVLSRCDVAACVLALIDSGPVHRRRDHQISVPQAGERAGAHHLRAVAPSGRDRAGRLTALLEVGTRGRRACRFPADRARSPASVPSPE